jgi:hypothetical protein
VRVVFRSKDTRPGWTRGGGEGSGCSPFPLLTLRGAKSRTRKDGSRKKLSSVASTHTQSLVPTPIMRKLCRNFTIFSEIEQSLSQNGLANDFSGRTRVWSKKGCSAKIQLPKHSRPDLERSRGKAWPERCQVTLPRLEILADSRKSLARRIRRPPLVSNEVERWREEERLRKVANHLGLGRRSRGRA